MKLTDLIHRTRLYCRDNNSYVFTDAEITIFLNEAIDYLRQYLPFRSMKYLEHSDDEPIILPDFYHYILSLYASSRCFDKDERFYEGTEKRNEFEKKWDDLLADIHAGNVVLSYVNEDDEEVVIEDETNCTDQIVDDYFNPPREEIPEVVENETVHQTTVQDET